MTTEDRVPRELRERMDAEARGMTDHERVIFYSGIALTLQYVRSELHDLATALTNSKPRLIERPPTVRR